jgi:GNAT superfamily N-acetyltransferase
MSEPDSSLVISALAREDAHAFAPLIAAYSQALKRGAPREPDQYYAEKLLSERGAEYLGAWIGGHLVGFIQFHDLPEPVNGSRSGLASDLFVAHEHRGKGIAKALIDVLADQAQARGWSRLMLHAPKKPESARRVYESVAEPADWMAYVLNFER